LGCFECGSPAVERSADPVSGGLLATVEALDVLVITAPLTDDTHGLVDKAFLSAMPDGAVLVNAGRGKIVYTDALVTELQSGRLRAALDVTEPEPLPPGHPPWECPNVIISPHVARTVPGTNARCYEVAARQIGTFAAGESPVNVIASGA